MSAAAEAVRSLDGHATTPHMSDCVFCRVIAGEIAGSFVYRDDVCAAFMDIQPINRGHTLIAPLSHVASLTELDVSTAGHLFAIATRVAAALQRSGLPCDGVNLLLSDGEVAGQEVPHLHLHVLPRTADDGFGFRFPPGYPMSVERNALDAASTQIRDAMRSTDDDAV